MHPELGEFLEIQRIQQEQQDTLIAAVQLRKDQRAFWQNVAQNFILLGVNTPVLLTKSHLFGL